MKRVFVGGLLLVGLVALAGCCDKVPANAVTECQKTAAVPGAAKTDILFVVDDSMSMAPRQANLANNFQAFIDALADSPVKNDYQIGITTTSVEYFGGSTDFQEMKITGITPAVRCPNIGDPYPAGTLITIDPASPNLPIQGTFISDGPRILAAASDTLTTDFQTNAHVGVCGSVKEDGLQAMRLALRERIADGKNEGFLRPGARLAVIIVSDEDDCTEPAGQHLTTGFSTPDENDCHNPTIKSDKLEPVQNFIDFLRSPISGELRDVVVAAIVIDPTKPAPSPSACEVNTYSDNGDRYAAVVSAFGSSGVIDSICNPSFASTLQDIAGLIIKPILPLDQAPADWRMLSVSLVKESGQRVACTVGLDGTEGTYDVIYIPPTGEAKAKLTFREGGACALEATDKIDLKTICAG